MINPRNVLLLTALAFLAFGLVSLFAPEMVVGPMGVVVPVPMARAEIRAFYGGAEIGLALFFFLSASRGSFQEAATLLATLVLGGIFVSRMLGMVFELFFNSTLAFAGVIELAGAVINFYAYRQLKGRLKSR